ncbi:hypothetical protein BDFB_006121, partial [Asbolus verrucosus]
RTIFTFLKGRLFHLLKDVHLEIRTNSWFLHDGPPCHSAHINGGSEVTVQLRTSTPVIFSCETILSH